MLMNICIRFVRFAGFVTVLLLLVCACHGPHGVAPAPPGAHTVLLAPSASESSPSVPRGWEGPFVKHYRDMTEACVLHEGVGLSCPPSFSPWRCVFHPEDSDPYLYTYTLPPKEAATMTICCRSTPASVATLHPSVVAAPPPLQFPQVCAHTGVQECDAYVAALYEYWRQGTPKERAAVRPVLDLGCETFREGIAVNGLEGTRVSCVVGLDAIDRARRASTPASPRLPPIIVPNGPNPPEVQ